MVYEKVTGRKRPEALTPCTNPCQSAGRWNSANCGQREKQDWPEYKHQTETEWWKKKQQCKNTESCRTKNQDCNNLGKISRTSDMRHSLNRRTEEKHLPRKMYTRLETRTTRKTPSTNTYFKEEEEDKRESARAFQKEWAKNENPDLFNTMNRCFK